MKKIVIYSLIILSLSIIIFLKDNNDRILENNFKIKSNLISMMVEQSDGSYKEEKNQKFVSDGYILNTKKSGCENGGKIIWNETKSKIEADLLTSDKCYVYFDIYSYEKYCEYSDEDSFVCEVAKRKDNSLIYHDGKADYSGETNVSYEAEDNSYRFAGSNNIVNNYVCFGSDESICPNSSLYRIIGLFLNDEGKYEAKLIKADYTTEEELGSNGLYVGKFINGTDATTSVKAIDYYKGDKENYLPKIAAYQWNNDASKIWKESKLNLENLNDYYLNNYLGNGNKINENPNKWQQMLVLHPWQIGGNKYGYIEYGDNKLAFQSEIISPETDIIENAYVGTLYVSEYDYASAPGYWHNNSSSKSDSINENWLHVGCWEWTITKIPENGNICTIRSNGSVWCGNGYDLKIAIRPSFYLKNETRWVSGSGTKNNPYRITI